MYGELSGTQIDALLRREMVGHLGCYGGGRPYVVPITYAYDGAHIYGYTREGMKLRMMRAHPTVCVQVDHITGIIEWKSVIAWGTFEELHGEEARAARRLIEDRFGTRMGGTPIEGAHGMGGWDGRPPSWQEAVLYQITLTTKSGRFERH
jgi:nitroimidazol reductase NimA-like FMN-containing flavoprotein (pyridoxamine 5'-phosphate oxidase superfamily)